MQKNWNRILCVVFVGIIAGTKHKRGKSICEFGSNQLFNNSTLVFVCTDLWGNSISVSRKRKSRTFEGYYLACNPGSFGVGSAEYWTCHGDGSYFVIAIVCRCMERVVSCF